jgi:hypothetical protein
MNLSRISLVFSNITLLIPLGLYSYYGFFSRYLADDFCTSAYLKQLGFLNSMQFWRETWSGRYSFYFFMNLIQSTGHWITPLITAIMIFAWLAALFIFTKLFLRILKLPESKLFTLFFASLILFATLDGAPDIYQSLYWQTGAVTYVFPLVIFTFYGAFLLKKLSVSKRIGVTDAALSTGIPLIAGGFSETFVSVQTAAILALLMLVFVFARGGTRHNGVILLGWGLLGTITALILVVIAPGNAARISIIPDTIRGYELVYATYQHTLLFTKSALYFTPISAATALIAPGLLITSLYQSKNNYPTSQSLSWKKHITILIIIPFLTFFLIAGAITPSLYATADPTQRALITGQFILIFSFAIWSLLFGLFLIENIRKYTLISTPAGLAIVLLLISGSVLSLQKTLSTLPDVQNNAILWDRRDREVREAVSTGAQEIEAISLPHLSPGLAELSTHSDDWINQCFALHYNVKQVSAK